MIAPPIITGPGVTVDFNLTPMRIHELAIQWWCHNHFFVRDGYPVPVIFSKPMDAFADFKAQWGKGQENPYAYLLDPKLVDKEGTPLYEPYPSPARYPLISITRRRQAYRNYGTFSIHRARHISWPTTSKDVHRQDLGNVRVRNRPLGVNFHLDISFFCLRPDTQALFMQNVWACFWRNGAQPQTWIRAAYPTEEGKLMVRMCLESDLNDATEEDRGGKQIIYQTTFSVRVEGYQMDLANRIVPALWEITKNLNAVLSPTQLETIMSVTEDLRDVEENAILDQRPGIPIPGTVTWNPP